MRRVIPRFTTSAPAPRVPAPYSGEALVTLPTEAGMLMIPASDGVIRPYLERNGDWEPEEAALLQQFFRDGLRFLDVGANVGYFSLYVAARCPGAVIHAFEPHPVTSQVLALNAWSCGAAITTHAMALSAGDRIVTLTTAESNLGDTRTSVGAAGTMVAPAAALDEVLPDAVFDLIKIDVQGFESDAIAGMSGMLARSPEAVIVAEYWPAALRERGLDPVAVLRDYEDSGFDVRVQVENDLARRKPRDVVALCDTAGASGQVNLVLTRKR
ncbi:FkbM family methyltransferase [Nocardioides daeguensis]|uniref:Methyltransferase FkbM domain-containing protein n=1 Tax=Nocardioides daeguensis TaxID=908359 RepID=A0ABP6WLT3_9ACTN|nr:FkbM family methyltransferase [Nocardioides daeguensis]MBV6729073.1 FkbM family methyltransferase [Nocardioides daeguensis]MCR1774923.1 FkbM family methyltransferase [Nocardioides daeguensis]